MRGRSLIPRHGGVVAAFAALLLMLLVVGTLPATATLARSYPGAPATLAQSASLLRVTLVGPGNMSLGTTATLHAMASGGTPPYLFHWNENGTTGSSGGNATLEFTPTSDNIYAVNVSVNDTGGNRSVTQLLISVTGPSPIAVQLSEQKLGPDSVQITASAVGGTPPYNYSWSGPGLGRGWGPSDRIIIGNLSPGTYRITVTARDSVGFSGSNYLTIVSNSPATTPGLSPFVWVGVGIGAGVGLTALVLWIRARKRKAVAPTSIR
jgi:SprB-like repeat protein